MPTPGRRPPHINVTPLIDVLLVLLIIFMVVAPSRPSLLETKVPRRPEAKAATPPAPGVLVVTVGADRAVTLNGTRLTLEGLGAALAAALVERDDRAVIVRAPTSLTYAEVVKVIDAVAGAGAEPIGLQVDYLEA